MQFTKFALAALSIGSAFAVPAQRLAGRGDDQVADAASVAKVTTVTTTCKSNIDAQIAQLNVLIAANITQAQIPTVQGLLMTLGGELQTIQSTVEPMNDNCVSALISSELTAVKGLLSDVRLAIESLETTLQTLIEGLPSSLAPFLQAEINFVTLQIQSIADPITNFASCLLGDLAGPLVDDVLGVVNNVELLAGDVLNDLTQNVLAPVLGGLGGLLGGILRH